jgi:hypothetical protein
MKLKTQRRLGLQECSDFGDEYGKLGRQLQVRSDALGVVRDHFLGRLYFGDGVITLNHLFQGDDVVAFLGEGFGSRVAGLDGQDRRLELSDVCLSG